MIIITIGTIWVLYSDALIFTRQIDYIIPSVFSDWKNIFDFVK